MRLLPEKPLQPLAMRDVGSLQGVKTWDLYVQVLRRKSRLTQAQFAARVGCGFTQVSRWEHGVATPGPMAQRRLHEIESELFPPEPAKRKRAK